MKKKIQPLLLARIGSSLAVLVFACLTAIILWKTKPEPKTAEPVEPTLSVFMQTATYTNFQANVETQGVVRPLRKVQISPEVPGKVIEISENLRPGKMVLRDEVLVRIHPEDYKNAVTEAKSAAAGLEAALKKVRLNDEANRKQLELTKRSSDLAKQDFDRAKKLSDQGEAVSKSVVESAERAFTQAQTQVLQLEQAIAQTPSSILELESEQAAVQSRIEQAERQLARSVIRAPFSGRVVSAMVEENEYLSPGVPIIELADDSVMEINVPVTATDLRKWIPFEENPDPEKGWFAPLSPIQVNISWSESEQDLEWDGILDRITRFDPTTRTAMIAVRIEGDNLLSVEENIALIEGMFCQVNIPGNEIQNVIALPRSAITFDNKCYLSVDGKLKITAVEIIRSEGDQVFISEGVEPGDQVIITRLVAPLEGARVVEAQPSS